MEIHVSIKGKYSICFCPVGNHGPWQVHRSCYFFKFWLLRVVHIAQQVRMIFSMKKGTLWLLKQRNYVVLGNFFLISEGINVSTHYRLGNALLFHCIWNLNWIWIIFIWSSQNLNGKCRKNSCSYGLSNVCLLQWWFVPLCVDWITATYIFELVNLEQLNFC